MFFQLLFLSIVSGMLMALVAVGFNLIFNTTKVFHLAHGAVYATAAYGFVWAWTFLKPLPSPLSWIIAVPFALLLASLLSLLIEFLVYRPMAKRNSNQAITLVASTAVYLFVINLIVLLLGTSAKFIQTDIIRTFNFFDVLISPLQLIQLIIAFVVLVAIIGLERSKWFLQIKGAISNNIVASVIGVNINYVRVTSMLIGGLLASICAILKACDSGINQGNGLSVTLGASVAVIIGGSTSLTGTIVASLLIAFLQTAAETYFSAQWREGITFLLLIFVLLWRTEGIVSFKMRIEEK